MVGESEMCGQLQLAILNQVGYKQVATRRDCAADRTVAPRPDRISVAMNAASPMV